MQKKTFWSQKAWDVNFVLWYHRHFKRIWSPLVNFIFMPARLSKQLGCDKRKSVKLFRKHVSDKQCLLFKMHHSLAMPPFSKLAIPKCLLQTIILASWKPGKMKTSDIIWDCGALHWYFWSYRLVLGWVKIWNLGVWYTLDMYEHTATILRKAMLIAQKAHNLKRKDLFCRETKSRFANDSGK